MSRNLATSTCVNCHEHTFQLSDLRDKPIEFRRYGPYAPQIGCKVACPRCNTLYFAIYRQGDKYWSYPEDAFNASPNDPNFGKFARKTEFQGKVQYENTGYFVIDLSHYASYNDEEVYDEAEREAIEAGEKKPWYLCEVNADNAQWKW